MWVEHESTAAHLPLALDKNYKRAFPCPARFLALVRAKSTDAVLIDLRLVALQCSGMWPVQKDLHFDLTPPNLGPPAEFLQNFVGQTWVNI